MRTIVRSLSLALCVGLLASVANAQDAKTKPRVLILARTQIRDVELLRRLLAHEAVAKRAELTVCVQGDDKTEAIDGEKRLNAFPDRLGDYDVIFAFGFDWSKVSDGQLGLLQDWVKQGGGFLYVAGNNYHLGARPKGKDLQSIVPVVLQHDRLGESQYRQMLRFSASAKDFDFLKLDDEEEGPTGGWSRYFGEVLLDGNPPRGFLARCPMLEVRPEATVLASCVSGNEHLANDKDGLSRPYLVTMPFGKGKTMYLGSPETWRLRNFNEDYHQRFWTRLTAYLAAKSEQPKLKDPPKKGTQVKKVLIIDGEDAKGREEGKDSSVVMHAIASIPGKPYESMFGDKLVSATSAKALDCDNLAEFKFIFLLNVPELTPKQVTNLEKFVQDGGGAMFFLGPKVNAKYYNKNLYKEGKGVFPAPLNDTYFPAPNDPPLEPDESLAMGLLIRDEKFTDPKKKMPIFLELFEDIKQREVLRDFPVRRYFKVDRAPWKPDANRVFELANLPNKGPTAMYVKPFRAITESENVKAILADKKFRDYVKSIERHHVEILAVASQEKGTAPQLGKRIALLLIDKGDPKDKKSSPDLTPFWDNADPRVKAYRKELLDLFYRVRVGDPYVVASHFGKGKVVAVMSTAGKDWNDWCGGSAASLFFAPFIWESLEYLATPNDQGKVEKK